jgi:hypothetical protein
MCTACDCIFIYGFRIVLRINSTTLSRIKQHQTTDVLRVLNLLWCAEQAIVWGNRLLLRILDSGPSDNIYEYVYLCVCVCVCACVSLWPLPW